MVAVRLTASWRGILQPPGAHAQLELVRTERGAARRGHGKVERGHRWGLAKAERGHRWSAGKRSAGSHFYHTERASVATI